MSKSNMERIVVEEEEEEEEEDDIFYSPKSLEEENRERYWNDDHVEKKKVDQLRESVEKQDSACKNVDDVTLRRFLRACELDTEKASAMYIKHLEWRRAFVPEASISASEVPNQLSHNKVFMQGTDRRECPVLVIFGAKHFPQKGGIHEFKRFLVFALDKICSSKIPDGEEKFIIIVDLKGYGYSNIDIRGYVAALSILQDYYPERLNKMFLVHVPYIFMTAWKIIYPFIDNRTKKKIIFVENKKLNHTLLEEIEENQLPEIYKGKLQLLPIQDG